MESTTYLLRDENGKDHAIFSGDTLFLGDVGRPDLAQKAASMTQEELAGTLYESLMTKIMPLADDVTVYPAHGAGSACGKNMMKETVDSLGNQKKVNYALNQPSKEAFIDWWSYFRIGLGTFWCLSWTDGSKYWLWLPYNGRCVYFCDIRHSFIRSN